MKKNSFGNGGFFFFYKEISEMKNTRTNEKQLVVNIEPQKKIRNKKRAKQMLTNIRDSIKINDDAYVIEIKVNE